MNQSPRGIVDLVSKVREEANGYLEKALRDQGMGGIVPAHGQILLPLLKSGEPLTLGEIARMSGRAKSTITGMADTLEKYGYIRRIACPDDKRSVRVELTREGTALKEVMEDISDRLQETLYLNVTQEEQEITISTLVKVLSNLTARK